MCDYDDEETTPQCIEFIYINFGDKCKLKLLPVPSSILLPTEPTIFCLMSLYAWAFMFL